MGLFKERNKQIEFLSGCDWIEGVRDRFGDRASDSDLNNFRVLQDPGTQALNLWRNCRGEQQGLPLLRTKTHYLPNIGQETHIHHTVHLVEHEDFYRVKPEESLLMKRSGASAPALQP